ncbi:glycosyltransferase family 2 protein [Aureimonas frigidaquae]|uniref:glycosyltransferase family 2 protein n=1 Tax=Aureimonas frigidaquae TaxID=424757 RepID=UPI00078550D7|nr:glycosyltransferase family 2 protein [Aureimonas frigidaquae]
MMARCLIVVPCLNEAAHIGGLVAWLVEAAERLDGHVVVADGGSTDGTLAILAAAAQAAPRLTVFHNARRIQSAGVNAAVARYGADAQWLIRVDAHGDYPEDFLDRILADAEAHAADSVVVGMVTRGEGLRQSAAAMAQNSRLGNGGSAHRAGAAGHWTDHGHHAAMRIDAFKAVGGYDESFSHNEDAELDHRLRMAGKRIWMTGATAMTYYPRTSLRALGRQYFGYGKGRAMNILKHRMTPRLRQMIPVFVAPALLLILLAPVSLAFLVPALAWALLCLGYGLALGLRAGRPATGALAGVSAMIMHAAWSAGFWRAVLTLPRRREALA